MLSISRGMAAGQGMSSEELEPVFLGILSLLSLLAGECNSYDLVRIMPERKRT